MKTDSISPEVKPTPYINPSELTLILHELGDALHSAERRSQRWLAWQQLHLTDHDGLDKAQQYTPEALAILEKAYELNEVDDEVIHHLAVAYHALAWDLELRQSDMASEAWKKALFYWRKLQSYSPFWQNLYTKGEMLGAEFQRGIIEAFREKLVQYLLEIHVNFIRHYYELKSIDQASRHVQLIKEARLPPAARRELEILTYEAMTSTLPNVVAEGRFDSALTMLDGFLSLFSAYLPALQTYLEVTKKWIDQLSPAEHWSEILNLDKRVLPWWETLNSSTHLSAYPLAKVVLNDLASGLGGKHLAKARSLRLERREAEQTFPVLECEEYQAYERALLWYKKATAHTFDDSAVRIGLCNALLVHAEFVANVGWHSNKLNDAEQLFQEALSQCQEAMDLVPDETAPRILAAQTLFIKTNYKINHLPAGLSDTELIAYLKSIEEDLVKAIQFDSDNLVLQESLDKIRNIFGFDLETQ